MRSWVTYYYVRVVRWIFFFLNYGITYYYGCSYKLCLPVCLSVCLSVCLPVSLSPPLFHHPPNTVYQSLIQEQPWYAVVPCPLCKAKPRESYTCSPDRGTWCHWPQIVHCDSSCCLPVTQRARQASLKRTRSIKIGLSNGQKKSLTYNKYFFFVLFCCVPP